MKKIMMGVALLFAAATAAVFTIGGPEATTNDSGQGPAKCCKCNASTSAAEASRTECCPCP